MPFASNHNTKIYYEIHGRGDPLVLIPGLSNDISELSRIIEPLSLRYKVIAIDNRGAGRSGKPDTPYSISIMADDAAAVMNEASLKTASVLGISMGGRIALELTLQHPDKVNQLVLVSTAARTEVTWQRTLLLNVAPRIPLFKGKYPQPYYAFSRQRQASSSYNAVDRLHEISAPTLILHGQTDKIAPSALAEELHHGIHASQLQYFKGGHLFFHFGQRVQFIDAVTGFINQ